MKKALREIQSRLRDLPPQSDPQFIARYVGSVGHEDRAPDEQSRLKFLGLKLPQLRALAKETFSFSTLPLQDQLAIWLALYHQSNVHEELTLALIWLAGRPQRELLMKDPRQVLGLQSRIDNWATSDGVSDFVSELLERQPKYFTQIKKWNRSKNPWERRQSLVGLYFYARLRKRFIPVERALVLVENRLADPHFFVQKAVGWCLREIYHVNPTLQKRFVLKHCAELSSAAFATASEKYSAKEKALALSRRKKLREKSRNLKAKPIR